MTTVKPAGPQDENAKQPRRRRRPMLAIDAANAQHLWPIIDWRRKDIGLTVRGLARHTGINASRLSSYLRGQGELGSNHIDVLLYSLGLRLTVEPGFDFKKRPRPTRLPRNIGPEPIAGEHGTGQSRSETSAHG